MRNWGAGAVLLGLLVGCAAPVGDVDPASEADVEMLGGPFGSTGTDIDSAGAANLDALPWSERIGFERALAEHDERYQPRILGGGMALSPPAGPLAFIGPSGARLALGGEEEVRLAVVGVGREGAPIALSDAAPTISGAEVRRELATGVREWWRALPSGLEHGVTLAEPPAREGTLVIDVEVGGLVARPSSDTSVSLVRQADGARVATYAQLLVYDAGGTYMPARMSVVGGRVRIEVEDVNARYPLVVDPLITMEEAGLFASGSATDDQFGWSVALTSDGSRALVGSRLDETTAGWRAGSARVFARTGASWMEEATLLASDAATNDQFGFSVALTSDGSRALVGVPFDEGGTSRDVGSARIFARSGTSWLEEATLLASDGAVDDVFGYAVALTADGSRALVGAYWDNTAGGFKAGSARVFVRSGTSWMEEATLLASDGAALDEFGTSVAITSDGSRALVGVPNDETAAGRFAGSARVFVRSGTSWMEEATLLALGAMPSVEFGRSVALSSDGARALVGSFRDGTSGRGEAGSARVFVRSGTSWMEEATLRASGGAMSDWFGWSVALSSDGRRALVGAYRDDTTFGDAGSAGVFLRSGTSWTEESTLLASVAAMGDGWGWSVALAPDGSRALVGAPFCDTAGGSNAGCARVFTLGASNGTSCRSPVECDSGFCTDGVCCESHCGGSASDDCQTCSVEAGGLADGRCSAISAAVAPDVTCRPSSGGCDVAEVCTSSSRLCPADECDDSDMCTADTCDGAGGCTNTPIVGCCAAGMDCDDGDACTVDACDGTGGCTSTAIEGCCNADLDCDDADACTEDTCSGPGGACLNDPIAGCGVDAGAADDAGTDAGAAVDAGSVGTDGGAMPPSDSGCACRAPGGAPARDGQSPLLWVAPLLFVLVRRRR